MGAIQVLLVEDDETVAGIIRYHLEEQGEYSVTTAACAGEALAHARASYDVILLDIMLPDADGIRLCEQLRKWHSCPIIFISCLDDSDTLIDALNTGGDDYLTKPFDNRVLDARIKAALRRVDLDRRPPAESLLSCKRFKLDTRTQDVIIGKTATHLLPMEYRILLFLMQHPLRFYSASELYAEIWDEPSYGDVRTVTVHIYNLRKKIEADPKNPLYLVNAWGKGYMFNPRGKGY